MPLIIKPIPLTKKIWIGWKLKKYFRPWHIKFYFKIKKNLKQIEKEFEMKKNEPGRKTTEFWMSLISQFITIAGALQGHIDPHVAAIVLASLNGVYGILRTLRKNSADKVHVEELKQNGNNPSATSTPSSS